MSKWAGNIGYCVTEETAPSVWTPTIVERHYTGDVIKRSRRLDATDRVNDDIVITNDISIVADPFALDNLISIRYITFMGAKWRVSNIDVQYPRLNLTVGGLYNGE